MAPSTSTAVGLLVAYPLIRSDALSHEKPLSSCAVTPLSKVTTLVYAACAPYCRLSVDGNDHAIVKLVSVLDLLSCVLLVQLPI